MSRIISISVPEALRARMRKHPEVNWSRLAQRAFEQHINKLEKPEGIPRAWGSYLKEKRP
jgi:hypothetical protein